MARMKIDEIEGIGPAYGEKLRSAGITDTDLLLQRAASRKGRKDIAALTDLSEALVLKWANMADLFPIQGVGPEYAELLEAAGVDAVKELRNRKADSLAAKIAEVNESKKLTRRVPTVSSVQDWVAQAKALQPVIEH